MQHAFRMIGGLASLVVIGLLLAGLALALGACGQPRTAQQAYPPPATPLPGYPPPTKIVPTSPPPPTRIPPTPTVDINPPFPNPILKPVPVPPDILAGEKIAFLKDKNLQIINPASRAQARGTTSSNVTRIFGWSPDGRQLLLGVGDRPIRPESDMAGGRDLWVLNVRSGRATQLTQGLKVRNAAWSPVNDQIAYVTRDSELWIADIEGHRQQIDTLAARNLNWSPDGKKLAFELPSSTNFVGRYSLHIAVLDLISGEVMPLTSDTDPGGAHDINAFPIWSLDGEEIFFYSERDYDDSNGLKMWYKMNADGSSVRRLDTPKQLAPSYISRSPTTNLVAYTLKSEVWTVDFQGRASIIHKGSEIDWFFTWSPDGNRVAIANSGGLWIINAAGTASERLTRAGRQPHWTD